MQAACWVFNQPHLLMLLKSVLRAWVRPPGNHISWNAFYSFSALLPTITIPHCWSRKPGTDKSLDLSEWISEWGSGASEIHFLFHHLTSLTIQQQQGPFSNPVLSSSTPWYKTLTRTHHLSAISPNNAQSQSNHKKNQTNPNPKALVKTTGQVSSTVSRSRKARQYWGTVADSRVTWRCDLTLFY